MSRIIYNALRTEQNRTEQNRTEQNRTEQNRTEQNVGRRANCVVFVYNKISEKVIDHLLDGWIPARIPAV